MKKYILFSLAFYLMSNYSLLGQEQNKYDKQIGINTISYKYLGKDNDYLFFENKPNFICGILFQKEHKYFNSRYSINYNRYRTEVEWIGPDSYEGFHLHSFWSVGIGLQKNFNLKKLSLFYGIDLSNNLIVHKVNLDGGYNGEGDHSRIYDNWVGISPLIGVQYRYFPRISLKLETSYNLELITYSNDFNSDTDKVQSYFNPISSLAICYHF